MSGFVMSSDIARILHGRVFGKDLPLKRISLLRDSQEDSLLVLYEPQSNSDLTNVKFGAVIYPPQFMLPTDRTFIVTAEKVWNKLYKIVELFLENGIYRRRIPHNMPFSSPIKQGYNCIIGQGTRFGENVTIGDGCVIGSNAIIGDDVIIGDNVIIECGAVVGNESFQFCFDENAYHKVPNIGTIRIGNDVEIGANSTIERGSIGNTIIGNGSKIGDLVHIGHETIIVENTMIVAQTAIAGWSEIGNNVTIYGQSGIANFVKINDNAVILAKSGVTRNVRESESVWGIPAQNSIDFMKQQAFLRRSCDERRKP